MMPEQEKVMTKIQKWLKDMKIDYNFSLKQDMETVVLNFKDLDENAYRIETDSGWVYLYTNGSLKLYNTQTEVIKVLNKIDYKFGSDMDKLNKERENADRFKRIQKALDDVKREHFYFGGNGDGVIDDYELIIETNGLGMKRAYSKKLKGRDFMPDVVIRDSDDYRMSKEQKMPSVLIQTSNASALNVIEAIALVKEITNALEAVVYFGAIIRREWATMERIEIV